MVPRHLPGFAASLTVAVLLSGCSSEVATPEPKTSAKRVSGDKSSDELPPGVSFQKARAETPLLEAPEDYVAKAESSRQALRALERSLFNRWLAGGPLDPREVQSFLEETRDKKARPPIEEPELAEGEKPWIADGKPYRVLAEQAARFGRFRIAHDLYCASFLADEMSGQELVRYSDLLQCPVWRIRFGVSLTVHGSSQFGPQPIRDTGKPIDTARPLAATNSNQLSRGGASPGAHASSNGESVASGSGSKENPSLSTVGSEVESSAEVTEARAVRGSRVVMGELSQRLDAHLGLVARIVGETISDSAARGAYGTLSPGALQSRSPGQEKLTDKSPIAMLLEADQRPPVWYQDIQLVDPYGFVDESERTGKGQKESEARFAALLEGARRGGVDVLVHFDVYLKETDGATRNLSRCRLFLVETRQLLAESRGIDSVAAQKPDRFGRPDPHGYAIDQLKPILAAIQTKLPIRELPPLTPEFARNQIKTLLATHDAGSITTVAMIDLYHKMNLIDEEQADHACHVAGGAHALRVRRLPQRRLIAETILQKAADDDSY